jgi:hypothetical protein
MRITIPLTLLATALVCSLASVPAHARARVFVASYGSDSNPCTFGSPCKTFQVAVNAVDAGGEVTAIDSAGFGPISISKSITITSPDGVEAGIVPNAGGDAIDINGAAATITVVLRGLTIDGSTGGTNGIVFEGSGGGSLTIINCVVKDFATTSLTTGRGVWIEPTAGSISFTIANTIAVNNGLVGISYFPQSGNATAIGAIDHAIATGNGTNGIAINGFNSSGATVASISNSVTSNNTNDGIFVNNATVTVDNDQASNNDSYGIQVLGGRVILSRSTITENAVNGIYNMATVETFQNNQILANGNGNVVQGNALTPVSPQ